LEITKGLLDAFKDWLLSEEGTGEVTAASYVKCLEKALGVRVCGKGDVGKVFKRMGGVNDKTYKAFRRLLTFLEKKFEAYDELVVKLKKALPKRPKSREDSYVPPDSLITKVRDRVRELGPPYTLFYNVLVSTGCRGVEARYLIRNVRGLRAVKLPYGAVRVHVDLQRGSKNEFVMYLPEEVYAQLMRWGGKLPHEDTVEKKLKELGLGVKYFRKWWRQLCKRLGIDSEDIEAFQGRVSSVGGRHYTDWIPILDEDYRVILPKVREFIAV